jgi:glycosyltransferase involved in cell wall biosynthesis
MGSYMIAVSLVVITLNEEKNIKKCLDSAPFANEKIVIDSGSTDNTVQIAKKCGAKVIHHDWEGYGKQKSFAISCSSNNWILLLDADEFLSDELIKEIPKKLGDIENFAYELPIKQIFMGKICNYGRSLSWPVRLYDRSKGSYDLKNIHESFIPNGKVHRLNGYALHNSATTVTKRLDKIQRDVELEIQNNYSKSNLIQLLIDPFRYFVNIYIKKSGYKDGLEGFILSALFSYQIFSQHLAHLKKNLNS